MRTIKELQHRLRTSREFEHKYPEFREDDGKVHLLYVSPSFSATGYYRMIVPALELNKTTTHSAILTTIENAGFNKRFEDFENLIDEQLVHWADYIIFPPVFSDLEYLFQALRILNQEVQIVMDVPENYHAIPKNHPKYSSYSLKDKKAFLRNLSQVDIVTTSSTGSADCYFSLLREELVEVDILVEPVPSLVSRFGYEETPPLKRSGEDMVRIGLVGTVAFKNDFLLLKEVLPEIKKSFKEKIEFVFLGWDGTVPFREIDATYHKSVHFKDYFGKLNDLKPDIVLLPSEKKVYSKQKPATSFLELAVFGIPVVASADHPSSDHIEEGETGLLATSKEEWIEQISTLVKDGALRQQIGKNAMKTVWRSHSYTRKRLERLFDIFI